MFNIGLSEFIVILFVSLICLKPKDLVKIIKLIINVVKKIKIFILNTKLELEKISILDNMDDYVKIDKKIK